MLAAASRPSAIAEIGRRLSRLRTRAVRALGYRPDTLNRRRKFKGLPPLP
jgi:hypothetical protein